MDDARGTPPIVDAHLDLAFNAVTEGRDLTLPLDELRARERRSSETAMVTWPELRAAGVNLVFGTLYASPAAKVAMQPTPDDGAGANPGAVASPADGYVDAEGAHAQALAQLTWYQSMERDGWISIVRDRGDLDALRTRQRDDPIGLVLLMEGADPIRTPDEARWWWEQGVRIVGPAWQRTRYAGGTRAPGPLTALGRELMREMSALGMALDVSHLSDESLAEALELHSGPVLASHSNARALSPTDRHLSDEALRGLAARDAVVGLVLGSAFLDVAAGRTGAVGLERVGEHFRHMAAIVGADRVGIGSDLDGGFGLEETPVGLSRAGDLARLGDVVPASSRDSFLGGAWWSWLERALPSR